MRADSKPRSNNQFDVIIVGGGVTGAGTARDCALRGLRTLIIERHDIADGATGRNHGLLHSGARYAMKDPESASECIKENIILKKIARNCINDCGGLFLTLAEDEAEGYGLGYQSMFVDQCRKVGINAEPVDPGHAFLMDPSINPEILGAVYVPDGSVDPFRLTEANILDARLHGAQILLYTEVLSLIKEGDAVVGVRTLDSRTGTQNSYYAPITVNAAGIWGQKIAQMAGVQVGMFPAKGTLLVFGHRVNNMVLNRCRKSSDGDILVPGESVSIIGTTSTKIPYDECDNASPTADEVALMLKEGRKLAPSLASTRVIRAYSGVRPLVASDDDPSGRSISRGIVLLDHENRDGIPGFITITGGKLMTYRLMAEKATDLICKKLSVESKCVTAERILPGSHFRKNGSIAGLLWTNPSVGQKAAAARQGSGSALIDFDKAEDKTVICECENVTFGEIKYAVDSLGVTNISDLRRRTRVGMGTCQGTYCVRKIAKVLAMALGTPDKEKQLADEFISERWKGMIPVGWGDTLREMEFMQRVYKYGQPSSFK